MAPGPAISGIASGNAAMLRMCSSTACSAAFDFTLAAGAVDHLRRDPEQQQPAGDFERRQRDAEPAQQVVADHRRADQNCRRRSGRRAARRCAAPRPASRCVIADECRRQPDRIDHDRERDEG